MAQKALDFFLDRYKKAHIIFFGGEPLLNYKLMKSIIIDNEERQDRLSFSFTTNGTLLDEEKIKFFKERKISFKISYDGKKTQKEKRVFKDGRSSDLLVSRKLTQYRKELLKFENFHIRSTLDFSDLEAVRGLFEEMSQSFSIALSYVDLSKGLTEEEMKEKVVNLRDFFFQFILLCKKEGKMKLPLELVNLAQMVSRIRNHAKRKSFCSAGRSYFSISSEGGIYLCHRFNEDSSAKLGDIEQGFYEKSSLDLEEKSFFKGEPCQSCWVRNLCLGGCFHEHKLLARKNKLFCEIQRMEVAVALFYIKELE